MPSQLFLVCNRKYDIRVSYVNASRVDLGQKSKSIERSMIDSSSKIQKQLAACLRCERIESAHCYW